MRRLELDDLPIESQRPDYAKVIAALDQLITASTPPVVHRTTFSIRAASLIVLIGIAAGFFLSDASRSSSRVVPPPPTYAEASFLGYEPPPPDPTLRPTDGADFADPLELPPPTPEPTPKPTKEPEPWATHPPKPKLAGGPYKPWRVFNANVQAARDYAQSVLSRTSWRCLDVLADRESGWRVHAGNKSSGAYGIPQALPGSKMAWAGDDWRDNATTQIKWMIHYIKGRYGNPCIALDHSYRTGWY